jgi:para-aminobenzoate synthetase/4-amino-4-deoxychorismate lyase
LPLARTSKDGLPLLWFGQFARSEIVDATAMLDCGIKQIGPVSPAIDEREYGRRVAEVLALIAAGDIYQVDAPVTKQAIGTPARC